MSLRAKNSSAFDPITETISADQISYTRVYVMGESDFGQLGFAVTRENKTTTSTKGSFDQRVKKSNRDEEDEARQLIKVPKLCSYNILIKQVACGERHSHILS